MEKIIGGVIGLGWFGEHHLDTLIDLPYVDVRAICTRRKEHLESMAKKYNIPDFYTDYHDLLNDKNIQFVTIATHVKDHAQIAIDSLKAGKHVLLEKPMADSVENCDKILEETKKTDKFFMVGHTCRFGPDYAIAKEEIEAGKLGEILSIHAKRNLASWITESHLNKISSLFGDGVHDLDLAFWFTKSKPVSVYAQTRKTRNNVLYDDLGWALFKLSNNEIVVIEDIWCLPNNVPYAIGADMEIIGTRGMINIDFTGSSFKVLTPEGLSYPPTRAWPKIHGSRRGWLKAEFEYFLKSIRENKKPTVITPEESRDVVYAMRMAEKSAREDRIIKF
jgi:UDP-N-acetylglucosamine 3-dehydrogenase